MRSFRDLFSLILAMSILQLGGGVLGVLLPLALDEAGQGPAVIGLVQAAYSAGFMAGALAATAMLRRMGPIRAYSAAAAACAALTLALYWRIDAPAWALVRMVQGYSFVVMFAAGESWLAIAAPANNRGSVLGGYQVATKLALLAGPFLFIGLSPLSAGPFMIASAMIALSLIPMCATRQIEPAPPPLTPYSLTQLWRAAPAAVMAAFVVGISNGGMIALLPVYGARLDADAVTAAAALNAAIWIGGVLVQWPAGRISDRMDRRVVIAALGVAAVVGSVGLLVMGSGAPLVLALLFAAIWGGGALSIYGVAVAHAADAAQDQTPRAIALVLLIWAAGAMIGPVAAGALMQGFGPRGMFAGAAIVAFALSATMMVRRRFRDPSPVEEKAPFEPAPTNSPAIVGVDPRSAS